jgi:putative ABC transport system ATP-binding protein
MALAPHPGVSAREARRRAAAALDAVGLGHRADAHPDQLSGGQKQRVALARALVARPRLVLADEPTASLDRRSGCNVVTLLTWLARRRGVTVVLVSHDPLLFDVADRVLHLQQGRLSSRVRTRIAAAAATRSASPLAGAARPGAASPA